MDIKKIIKAIKHLVSVPVCVCCKDRLDQSQTTLCEDCREAYNMNKNRDCSVCFKPLYKCLCSNHYLERMRVKKLSKVGRYIRGQDENPLNCMIFSLKEQHLADTVKTIAEEMLPTVKGLLGEKYDKEDVIITHVPRSKKSISRYGYDHSLLLAREIASKLDLKWETLLNSKVKKRQKMTSGSERRKNAVFNLRRKIPDITDKTVIIVDDIVTTGSSIGACATALRELKPKQIFASVFAIAYLDNYIISPNKQN